MTAERWLIVGLGNPGPGYANNRHNAGCMVADVLAARMVVTFRAGKFLAAVADGRLAGLPVTLAKPLTFMNLSGGPGAGLGGGTPGTEAEAGARAEVGRPYGADEHEPPGHAAPPRDAGDGIAAELAGWAAGELPGQASARLAAWAAVGGVPTAGYRQPGTASAGTLAETAG